MALGYIRTAEAVNAAYTRLLFTISGSIYTDQPQYQYVLDVYETGGDLLKRMTQPVNPAGTATFDVSRVVQGELSADYNWKINSLTAFNSSSKQFNIKAGEQFGTSTSSSITVYPDQDNVALLSWQGVVEPNAGNYNWSYTVDSQILSNMPATMSMQPDDFGTISVYNDQGTFVTQSFYSSSAVSGSDLIEQKTYSTSGTYFNAIPISSSNQNWNYVDVSVSSSFGTESYRYIASNETHREKTRFAFVNQLGAWDYYNNYNPVRQAINVSREQYTAPRVDYTSRTSNYDISRRGKKDYHNSTDDLFTVDTDLLDKENANWLEELIESPEVYIQRNGEFIPIVITDTSYTSNQNQARQKQFKYTINFKPSNQPFGTWIPEYVQCPKPLINACNFLVNTNGANAVTYQSMTFIGSLTNQDVTDDITEVGFVYSTSSNTPILPTDTKIAVPGLTTPITASSFNVNTGNAFTEQSSVYFRAYASSSQCLRYGDINLQSTIAFVSGSVTTNDAFGSDCDGFSGSINFTTNDDTATGQGFVYSDTVTSPTIGAGTQVSISLPADTTVTKGVGGLDSNTTYYVRGYGIGAASGTIYGDVKTIVTDIATPSISSIAPAFGISDNSFSLTGSAAATEKPIAERGFVYSTSNTTPTIADTKIAVGSGDGQYTTAVSGVGDEATFYARAYASSSCDLAYSSVISFETLPTLYPFSINATPGNGFTSSLAMCDVDTANVAYSKLEFPANSSAIANEFIYTDISASAVFNGAGLDYGINNNGISETASRRLTISSSGFVTSQQPAPCPTTNQYYTVEDCETSTEYYSNFPVVSLPSANTGDMLSGSSNRYLSYTITGKIFNTGSMPEMPSGGTINTGPGSCRSFTFYEYRVNAQTGSGNPSGGTAACTPDLSVPIYTTEPTLELAIVSASLGNTSQFLFSTSSLYNIFNGGDGRYGIGNVGDTVPRSVIRISNQGVSFEGEVAECQSAPVIVNTLIDQQPYHSESINIAVTVEDQSLNPNIQSQIVEYGVYLGTDSGSATNNTKYVSTDNKVRKMYWTANQSSYYPGIEKTQLDFIEARTLDLVNPDENRTGETSPYTSSTFEFISASDSVTFAGSDAQQQAWADYTITYLSSSLTGSWENYSGLDITGSYYAWGYASSSIGFTTSSMMSFTTYPKNIQTWFNNISVNYSTADCTNCNTPPVDIWYPQNPDRAGIPALYFPVTGSETYPEGIVGKSAYASPDLTGQVITTFIGSTNGFYSRQLPSIEYGYLVSQSNWTSLPMNAFLQLSEGPSNRASSSLDIFYCPDECP